MLLGLGFFFFFSCYHFLLFYLEPSAGCCRQQMIATFPPEIHLIPPPLPRQKGVKKILQAVNELPSVPRVKGTCKLTAAFVRALAFSRSRACFLLLPLLPSSRSSIFSLYLPASCSGGSVAGAAPSGSLSARFMFRISRLMRTKEINWRFKPNETSVKLTGLINGNK